MRTCQGQLRMRTMAKQTNSDILDFALVRRSKALLSQRTPIDELFPLCPSCRLCWIATGRSFCFILSRDRSYEWNGEYKPKLMLKKLCCPNCCFIFFVIFAIFLVSVCHVDNDEPFSPFFLSLSNLFAGEKLVWLCFSWELYYTLYSWPCSHTISSVVPAPSNPIQQCASMRWVEKFH